jgi:hypothetical protein
MADPTLQEIRAKGDALARSLALDFIALFVASIAAGLSVAMAEQFLNEIAAKAKARDFDDYPPHEVAERLHAMFPDADLKSIADQLVKLHG